MNRRLMLLRGGALLLAGLGAVVAVPGRGRVAAAADTTITSQSIAYFERRLAPDPGNYMVAGRLINRYILRFGTGARMEDIARAEALARELARTQDKAPALARLSNVLLMQHKFAEAAATARDAVTDDSLNEDALGALADALLASGRYAEGEAALGRMRPGGLPAAVRRAQWLDASGHSAGDYAAIDRICRQVGRSSSRSPGAVARRERPKRRGLRGHGSDLPAVRPLRLAPPGGGVVSDSAGRVRPCGTGSRGRGSALPPRQCRHAGLSRGTRRPGGARVREGPLAEGRRALRSHPFGCAPRPLSANGGDCAPPRARGATPRMGVTLPARGRAARERSTRGAVARPLLRGTG